MKSAVLVAALLLAYMPLSAAPEGQVIDFDQGKVDIPTVIKMAKEIAVPQAVNPAGVSLVSQQQQPQAQQDAKQIGSFIFKDGNPVSARMDKATIEDMPGSCPSLSPDGLAYDLAVLKGVYEIRSPVDGLACIIGVDELGNAKAFSSRTAMLSDKSDVGLWIRRLSPHALVLSCSMVKQNDNLHSLADEGGSGPPVHGCFCRWVYRVCPPPMVGPCREWVCNCWNGPN